VTEPGTPYTLRVTRPADRQLSRLPERVAAAIVEFLLGPLLDDPHRVGGRQQRELAGMHAARRGAYRIVYEMVDDIAVVVGPPDRSPGDVYRPR